MTFDKPTIHSLIVVTVDKRIAKHSMVYSFVESGNNAWRCVKIHVGNPKG
jgi:hypothetical protein